MTSRGPEGPSSALFRSGVAHFNEGRYFEAHEDWEDLWRGLSGEDRLFVQALIQASVALHHLERGNHAGARQLAKAAFAKLSLLPSSKWGVDCESLADALAARLDPLLRQEAGEGSGPARGLPPIRLRVDSALPE
jgi:predicted metal-dependent hydrolase